MTALGDRAFSASPPPPGGEELCVSGPGRPTLRERVGLRELTLPPGLNSLGDYALAGCRGLECLYLTDRSIRRGAGIFTNCPSLRRFVLDVSREGPGDTMAWLAGELSGTLDVSLRREGETGVRLIFPEYTEVYELNGPAHLFQYKVDGAGYPYHHVFRDRRLDLRAYDALWERAAGAEPGELTALAWWRLRYPAELEPAAAKRYGDWLLAHWEAAVRFALRERDAAGLGRLLERLSPGRELLLSASALAREAGDTAAAALLLEALHRQPAAAEPSFEL